MAEAPSRWQIVAARIERELREWRASHPDATLTAIEAALDGRLHPARASLLAAVATDTPEREEPCPHWGERLERRGTRTRTMRTTGDAAVRLTRTYLTCPACGAGLFPPR